MAQKEHVDVYTIPPNFAKEGTILSGRLEARNAVEAAVLALLLLQILMAVDISAKGKIYAGIIVILPLRSWRWSACRGKALHPLFFSVFPML